MGSASGDSLGGGGGVILTICVILKNGGKSEFCALLSFVQYSHCLVLLSYKVSTKEDVIKLPKSRPYFG